MSMNTGEDKVERSAPLRIQFDQGRYAFSRGLLSNYYDPDSTAGKEWQRGFDRAYFENIYSIKTTGKHLGRTATVRSSVG